MSEPGNNRKLLIVKDLTKTFPVHHGFLSRSRGIVRAVSGVSFEIYRGETLGLVGESGCGKSTLGRCVLRLIEPTGGQVWFDGQNVLTLSQREMRRLRRRMQIVFQDPYASLNPRMTVEDLLLEPLVVHRLYASRSERMAQVYRLLDLCGLRRESLGKYPHEFSGGQRQRICIARALALKPDLVVCDEPVSALDVSIQAQIINLMEDLQKELNLSYLFISHDLRVVEHISKRVAVMYLGKIVELALSEDLYASPLHPYTQALLSAIPIPDPDFRKERIILRGDVPSPVNPPGGCSFHPRCPKAQGFCQKETPELRELRPGHWVACHYPCG